MPERLSLSISIETANTEELQSAVVSGLYSYNDRFAGPMGSSMLIIGARSAGRRIVGGLVVNIQAGWKWIHLQRLWVDESHRRTGIGRRLVEAAEHEGQRQGCLYASVDTMEFQAREFYEKQGYTVYGVMEDYPVGHQKFLLRKSLQPTK